MSHYPNIRRALVGKLWYVHEPKMEEILAFFELQINGGSGALERLRAYKDEDDQRRARAARAQKALTGPSGSVAVIPIHGIISQRSNMFSEFSGGTSTEALAAQIRQAVNDPGIKSIVLDVDSPGGAVAGVDELASVLFQARKKKKITAVVNCQCASAAYYIASQATEIVASPSSDTGSIGVYCIHEDDSALLEKMGVKLTLIKFGENKAEGFSGEPLQESAHAHFKESVDNAGEMFEKAVARGRKISQDEVHSKFGQGRMFDAKKAVKIGMVDRVASFDEVLEELGVSRSGSLNAADGSPAIQASEIKADDTAPGDGCVCDCEPCSGGDCDPCACDACACAGCACDTAVSARKTKAAMNRRRLELASV